MIILTGASGGIGGDILSALSKIDQVIAIGNQRIPETNGASNITPYQMNLCNENEIDSFLKKMSSKLSKITIVHAAAISIDKLAAQLSVDDWDLVLNINLKGNFLLSKKLLKIMIHDKWGRIIHISSVAGNDGATGTLAYSTSKTGLNGMSRVFAKEYGRFGITSNVIIPGFLNTGLINSLAEVTKNEILKRIPSNQFGDPRNIVNAVEFLIKSEYVNGASINIDGGY
jgi:3-oxoacyl-[acyl-carrier protein] reductase